MADLDTAFMTTMNQHQTALVIERKDNYILIQVPCGRYSYSVFGTFGTSIFGTRNVGGSVEQRPVMTFPTVKPWRGTHGPTSIDLRFEEPSTFPTVSPSTETMAPYIRQGYHYGIGTGYTTVNPVMRNSNMQLRTDPTNPQHVISPWGNTTIESNRMPPLPNTSALTRENPVDLYRWRYSNI